MTDFAPLPPIDSPLARFPLAAERPWIGIAAALVIMTGALLLRIAIDSWLPPGFPFLTFFPAIVIAAFAFGLRAGLLAGSAGLFLSWYFFIPPFHSFAITPGVTAALGLYIFVVGVDLALIQWLQRTVQSLSKERESCNRLAENREVLFRELQHRVGNNLQMVSAMLALQRRKLSDPEAAAAIDEAVRRVGLIGRIQRQIYDPDGAQIGVGAFLAAIANDVIDASGRDDVRLQVAVADDLALLPEQAIPLALIVSEAIANSIEHGLASRGGTIRLEARTDAERLDILISDDGIGLPPGFDGDAVKSLGLRLATSLSRNMRGSFGLSSEGGRTIAQVSVPRV